MRFVRMTGRRDACGDGKDALSARAWEKHGTKKVRLRGISPAQNCLFTKWNCHLCESTPAALPARS